MPTVACFLSENVAAEIFLQRRPESRSLSKHSASSLVCDNSVGIRAPAVRISNEEIFERLLFFDGFLFTTTWAIFFRIFCETIKSQCVSNKISSFYKCNLNFR